jgi:hypothetical protein
MAGSDETYENRRRYFAGMRCEEERMKRTALILATVAALGTVAVSAPAEAHWRRGGGWGPGIGFGLAAGALAAGAFAASNPYYYGPGYYDDYYYPRRYYRRAYYAYGPSPYYYAPRYYRPHYYYGW